MATRLDLKGQKYGKLLVLDYAFSKNQRAYWKCRCDCGNIITVSTHELRGKKSTKSCGCLALETRTKHGYAKHELYHRWTGMHRRCYNFNDPNYSRYGERGIKVCGRWHSIENFINDMYPTFKKGLSLERIDNNGHYSPENCKWATIFEQNKNRKISSNIQSDVNHVSFKKGDNRWNVTHRFVNKENAEIFAKEVNELYTKYDDKPGRYKTQEEIKL